eukprot:1158578-Pelagomonas_calceolata.AAC.9
MCDSTNADVIVDELGYHLVGGSRLWHVIMHTFLYVQLQQVADIVAVYHIRYVRGNSTGAAPSRQIFVEADYSMREELVLKIAILAEKFAPSVQW